MNLSPDLQRFLPYVAVAVLGVVGVFLVSGGGTWRRWRRRARPDRSGR